MDPAKKPKRAAKMIALACDADWDEVAGFLKIRCDTKTATHIIRDLHRAATRSDEIEIVVPFDSLEDEDA